MKRPKWINEFAAHLGTPEGQPIVIKIKIGLVNASGLFLTEILFVMLPVLVLAAIHLHKDSSQSIWAIPEWSFIAAVLFGQAIPRMFGILAQVGRAFNPKTTSAFASLVIVLGLIPSLITLCLMLLAESPGRWLIFCQLFMFVLSVLTLLAFIIIQHLVPEMAQLAEKLWPDYVEPGATQSHRTPADLNTDKLDDAVLAMLSVCIINDEIGNRPGIQTQEGFDYDALVRCTKGATSPHARTTPST